MHPDLIYRHIYIYMGVYTLKVNDDVGEMILYSSQWAHTVESNWVI